MSRCIRIEPPNFTLLITKVNFYVKIHVNYNSKVDFLNLKPFSLNSKTQVLSRALDLVPETRNLHFQNSYSDCTKADECTCIFPTGNMIVD